MKSQNLQAIVVGRGIVGPALALLLKKAGMSSTVGEAHPHLEDVGGGFTIAPNGMNVLEEVGVADSIAGSGAWCRSSAFATTMARCWRAIRLGTSRNIAGLR
jgi:2-polyprenyl-6-methoxyphenol hydroxylase-like FAD-dependent oxidoreductase